MKKTIKSTQEEEALTLKILEVGAEMIKKLFTPNVEVVMIDLDPKEKKEFFSKIFNGSVSGRKGGEVQNYFSNLFEKSGLSEKSIAHQWRAPNGKILNSISRTYLNRSGETFAALSINIDTSTMQSMLTLANQISGKKERRRARAPRRNLFNTDKDFLKKEIVKTIWSLNLQPKNLTTKQKKRVARKLFDNGYFEAHGLVGTLALELDVTRQSIHRWSLKMKKEKKDQLSAQ